MPAMQSTPGFVRGVYIDTETGGLDALVHGTTEVAMVHFEIEIPKVLRRPTWKVLQKWQTFVKPQQWLAYSPGALEMQSRVGQPVTLEFLQAYGRDEKAVIEGMQAFLKGAIYPDPRYWNHQMWAQNADFDYDFISRMYERVKKASPEIEPLFTKRPAGTSKTDWSCTRKLASKLGSMGIPALNNQHHEISLRHLMKLFGVQHSQTHGALQDCYDGITVLSHLLAEESTYYRQLYQV